MDSSDTSQIESSACVPQRLWNIDFNKIFIIAFLYGVSVQMLTATLPYYIISLGASSSSAGLMMGGLTVFALVSRPVCGYILDNHGRKFVMLIGMIIVFVGILVYYFIPIVSVIIFFRIMQGIGISFATTANGTIAADSLPSSKLAEGIAYFGLANTMATAVGPALGVALLEGSGYKSTYLSAIISLVLAFLLGLSINYEKKRGIDFKKQRMIKEQALERQNGPKEKLFWRMFERSAMAPSICIIFIAGCIAANISFVPSYAFSKGISNAGIFFTITALAMLVVRLLTTRFIKKVNTILLIIPSLILFSFSFFAMAFINDFVGYVICAAIYGCANGSVFPLMSALAVRFAPMERRGAANATYFAAFDIGIGIGSAVWGFVIDASGFFPMYIGSGFVGIFSLILSIILLKGKKLNVVD